MKYTLEDQLGLIKRGVEEIIPEEQLIEKIKDNKDKFKNENY